MLSSTINLGRRNIRLVTYQLAKYSSNTNAAAETEFVDEEVVDREALIEARRNKSKLAPWHYRLLHGEKPQNLPETKYMQSLHFQRKILATFGLETGINPAIAWPSEQQLADIKEYESVCYPFTLQEMVEKSRKKRLEKEEALKKRERKIEENVAKLETWKREVLARRDKKVAEARAAQEKKERLIEEVRQYFGYRVDPKSEKFRELLEKKEKEQKKQEKESKKKEKLAKMMSKLQQSTETQSSSTPAENKTEATS